MTSWTIRLPGIAEELARQQLDLEQQLQTIQAQINALTPEERQQFSAIIKNQEFEKQVSAKWKYITEFVLIRF